jgi:hypothetical protein
VLGQLVCLGRHTLTGVLCTHGAQHRDWSADYRLYSRDRIDEASLFDGVRKAVEGFCRPGAPLVLALDDTLLRKRGTKIAGVAWRRDPLGPPFQINFSRAQRVVQISAALPQAQEEARMIPVDFAQAPTVPRPRRGASPEQIAQWRREQKEANINRQAAARLAGLAANTHRPLRVAVDGRFTNRTFLRLAPAGATVIGRVRKDAKFHYPPAEQAHTGRRRLYGAAAPSPEALRQDNTVAWIEVEGFAAGKIHRFRVKTLGPVRSAMTGARDLRVLVIAALGYRPRKGSRLLYRQPAYLLCTDAQLPLEELLQAYLWRWDIEVNFRDEKCLLGVGQAQVRRQNANQHLPATAVAAYSMLLLASARAYGPNGRPDLVPPPKWRAGSTPRRASTAELINTLRAELWSQSLARQSFRHFCSRNPPAQKPQKLQPDLASALFLAAA